MCESKKGMSANQLSRMLKTTYKTAWFLNHRIRYAVSQTTDVLRDIVEVDETFVGGRNSRKTIVVGITERKGRAVLEVKRNRKRKTLHRFVLENVDALINGIFTDDWIGYKGLPNHYTITHSSREYARDIIHTNTIEGVWSLLKRSIMGQFHSVSRKHLHLYLNELAWRISYRTPCLWELTLERMLNSEHLSYRDLTR